MSFVNRQLYKQKPQAWGPVSAVKASIFKNAERAGIDPGSIALCMPMWGGANYGNCIRYNAISVNTTVVNNQLYFSDGYVNFGAGDYFKGATELTILSKISPQWTLSQPGIVTQENYYDSTSSLAFSFRNNVAGKARLQFSISNTAFRYLDGTFTYGRDQIIGVSANSSGVDFIYDNVVASGGWAGGSFTSVPDTAGSLYLGRSKQGSTAYYYSGGMDLIVGMRKKQPTKIINYFRDNPYFLIQRVAPVFYSVPGGAVIPAFNPLFLNAAQPTRVIQ